jgi:hypothetical protein
LRILNKSYDGGRPVGTSRLQDDGSNLRQDFALPTRHGDVRILTRDESVRADERLLAPEEQRQRGWRAIRQDALDDSTHGALRSQLAECNSGLLARVDNAHSLAARRAVRLQYRRDSVPG